MTTSVTVIGNLSRDPELRFTPSGRPVASFGLAVGRRRKDGDTWVDDGTDWYDITCWGDLGQNVSESLEKGQRVVVVGRLSQRTWEAKDGTEKLSVVVTADEVGPSLRWATAETTKTDRRQGESKRKPSQEAPPGFDPSEEPF